MIEYPDGLGAVMFVEEVTGRRAWITDRMPVLPAVGDFIESSVDVLGPDEPKMLAQHQRLLMVGRVIERRFINRNGAWACILKMPHHSLRDVDSD